MFDDEELNANDFIDNLENEFLNYEWKFWDSRLARISTGYEFHPFLKFNYFNYDCYICEDLLSQSQYRIQNEIRDFDEKLNSGDSFEQI